MNFEELFENIDLSTPLTDEELDYLDIIGVTPKVFTSSEDFVNFVKKDLDKSKTTNI